MVSDFWGSEAQSERISMEVLILFCVNSLSPLLGQQKKEKFESPGIIKRFDHEERFILHVRNSKFE